MLVLTRDRDAVIRIGPNIRVKVLSIQKHRVKLGVEAPTNVRVWRDEIAPYERLPEDEPAEAPPGAAAEAPDFSILVVEDDPGHAKLIAKVLLESEASSVALANSGAEAMRVLGTDGAKQEADFEPQLVLLDYHLPDVSGIEVLRKIRATERLHRVPVVMLSSANEDAIVADCLDAGANAFVNKAERFPDFREKVARVAGFWRSECRVPRQVGA